MKNFKEKLIFMLNIDIQKSDTFIYFAIIVSAATLFSIIWPVMFAVHDDILFYMVVKSGTICESIINLAKDQGRFWFFVSSPLAYFPFIFDSFVAYKIISYISICFSIFALGFLLYWHVGKKFSMLSVLLFLVFAQIDTQHNLLICYVFPLQIAIGILLISIERLLTYYKRGKKNDLLWSAVLLFVAAVLYESFLLFSILLFIIAVTSNYKEKKLDIKNAFIDLRFHIALMSVYLLVYFLWRAKFPSSYDGVQVKFTSIFDSLRVILTYSMGRFPLIATMANYIIKGNIDVSLLELGFFIKGFVASVAIIMIIKKAETIKTKFAICVGFLAILGMLLPVIFHSITPKYVEWVKSGSYGYVPSFYSYFFIVTLLSVIIIILYQRIKYKRTLLLLLFVVIFSGSLLTDLNNKYYANSFEEQFIRYKTFDKAVSSQYFSTIINGSDIFIPDYIGIHYNMAFMNDYARIYTDKKFTFTNEKEELKFDKLTYVLKYDNSSGSMLMGLINSEMKSDEIGIISLTPLDGKSLILNKNTVGFVNVNNNNSKDYEKTAIIPFTSPTDNCIIKSSGMDILNSQVINERIISNEMQSVQVGDGFYNAELWGNETAYWCGKSGQILITNKENTVKDIVLKARMATIDKQGGNLLIKGENYQLSTKINGLEKEISIKLILQPGTNYYEISCDATSLKSINDSRTLVFYIINMGLE